MANEEPVDLFCWPAKDDLQSFGPECLTVLAYSKFAKGSVNASKCTGLQQYTASLPVLYNGDEMIEGMQPVLTFMRSRGWNADYFLTEKQQSDTLAFEALVAEKLHPAILHLQFVNTKNFKDCVRGFYANSCSFPWNFYIPGQLQKKAKQRLSVLHATNDRNIELPDSSFQKKVIHEARRCINLLSSILDDKTFIFGDSPTTMDAVLYGYMAFLLKSNLPNNVLCPHVRSCPNLTYFVARVDDQFMNAIPKVEVCARASSVTPLMQMSEDRKRQLKILASIGFGLAAMVAYAFLSGIVTISVEEDPETDYMSVSLKDRHDMDTAEETEDSDEQPVE